MPSLTFLLISFRPFLSQKSLFSIADLCKRNVAGQDACLNMMEEHKERIRELEGERADIANALVNIERNIWPSTNMFLPNSLQEKQQEINRRCAEMAKQGKRSVALQEKRRLTSARVFTEGKCCSMYLKIWR